MRQNSAFFIYSVISKPYIVIPCYNENPEVVRSTVSGLLSLGAGIILVDDGSREVLSPHLSDLPVTVLRHPVNRGQGAALQTGMSYALRHGADAVIHFDGDGQHNAADIPKFLEALDRDGTDVVLGSRFLRSEDLAAVPRRKRLLLRGARLVNGLFTGMWLTDAHNGFRALGRRALEAIDLTEDRMAHASEILIQIRRAKLKCTEVPTHVIYSQYSVEKGQSIGNSLNILIDLILERWL